MKYCQSPRNMPIQIVGSTKESKKVRKYGLDFALEPRPNFIKCSLRHLTQLRSSKITQLDIKYPTLFLANDFDGSCEERQFLQDAFPSMFPHSYLVTFSFFFSNTFLLHGSIKTSKLKVKSLMIELFVLTGTTLYEVKLCKDAVISFWIISSCFKNGMIQCNVYIITLCWNFVYFFLLE